MGVVFELGNPKGRGGGVLKQFWKFRWKWGEGAKNCAFCRGDVDFSSGIIHFIDTWSNFDLLQKLFVGLMN